MENIESLYAETINNQVGMFIVISTVLCISVLAVWYFGIKSQPKFHWYTFVRATYPALFFGLIVALQFFPIGYTQMAFEEILPQRASEVSEMMAGQISWYVISSMVLVYAMCILIAWLVSLFKQNKPKLAA